MCDPGAILVPPPPGVGPRQGLWSRLPPRARRRLVQLLAQLLERQVASLPSQQTESGHDGDRHA